MIGAGKSGLIASKVLKQRGIPFDCFEAGSQVHSSMHGSPHHRTSCSPGTMTCPPYSYSPCAMLEHDFHIMQALAVLQASLLVMSPPDYVILPVQVGGLWVLNSDSGRSAAYESLCINTSKGMTSFHDFPMPRAYPTFASREQVQAQ